MRYSKKDYRIKVDYNNMMSDSLPNGIGFKDLDFKGIEEQMNLAVKTYNEKRGQGFMGWTELPYNQDEVVKDIIETSKYIRKNFEYFVVLGIGGSALGPISVFQALNHLHHNDLPKSKRRAPKFYVEDNVDPERMLALLDVIDVKKTMFNVITKSGSTSETMTQYLIINDILKRELGDAAKDHIIATTSENSGELIKIAREEEYKTYYIPAGVGGRFSEMCPVGLLPAAVLRVDIEAMLAGAKFMDEICTQANSYKENPALISAALQYLAMKSGRNISVMMPYADSLKFISDWYAQLWAESLGKALNNDAKRVNTGQTPVKSLGVTDQHSQVQLYAEGPDDKVITFLAVDDYRTEVKIPQGCDKYPNVNFLCGHTMNELIQAEREATEYALTTAGRLNMTIKLKDVNPFTLGQLLMYFQIQTAYCGFMLNIDPFNQPGVEEGKRATYALLGKQGFEDKRKQLEKGILKSKKYTV